MAKYNVYVPPTMEQGEFNFVCQDSPMGSVQCDALSDYNSARAHDGQEPLKRMPRGTTYTQIVNDTPIATDEQTEEYLASQQEDRANEANERAIHIGEHGGALDE
jgi:hypothetical protein